jgi:putative transposase
MGDQRTNGHTVSRLTVHIVWITKYRYKVLVGDTQQRFRKLLIQIYDSEDIIILKGVVSKDHIHMHIEYLSSQYISSIVKKLKGITSRKIQ